MQNSASSEEVLVQGMMDCMDDVYDRMETESRYTSDGKSRPLTVSKHSSQMSSYCYQTQAKINLKLNCANQTISPKRKWVI